MSEQTRPPTEEKEAQASRMIPHVTLIDAGSYVLKVEAYNGPHTFATLTVYCVGFSGLMVNLNESQAEKLIEALSS